MPAAPGGVAPLKQDEASGASKHENKLVSEGAKDQETAGL